MSPTFTNNIDIIIIIIIIIIIKRILLKCHK